MTRSPFLWRLIAASALGSVSVFSTALTSSGSMAQEASEVQLGQMNAESRKRVQELHETFLADDSAMAMYVERSGHVLVLIYRDGRIVLAGIPRSKALPDEFTVLNKQATAQEIRTLDEWFDRERFLNLEYGNRQPSFGITGVTLLYRRGNEGKEFSSAASRSLPKQVYEAIPLVLRVANLAQFSCSPYPFAQAPCSPGTYRQPPATY